MKANVIRCDHCGAPLRIKNHTGTASVAECRFCKIDNRLTTTDEIQPRIVVRDVAPIRNVIAASTVDEIAANKTFGCNQTSPTLKLVVVIICLGFIVWGLFEMSDATTRRNMSRNNSGYVGAQTNATITNPYIICNAYFADCAKKCGVKQSNDNKFIECIPVATITTTTTTAISKANPKQKTTAISKANPKQKTIVEHTDMTRVAVKKGYTIPVIRESGI
jgi:hypothetical protein